MNLMAYFNFQMLLLLVSSKNTFSEQFDYSKVEENLIGTMKEIRSDILGLNNNLNEVKTSVDTIYFDIDTLKNNQDALDSKLEKVLLEVEVIKEIYEVVKHISLEVALCKESCNGTENLSDLFMENLSTDFESIKKLLNKTVYAETLMTSRNITYPKEVKSFGIYETGKEKTCTDFSKTFLSIVNALSQINPSQHKDSILNSKKCWKDLPKTMENHTYFVTNKLKQEAAAKYCELLGGKPFIPKSRDEFIFYVAMTVEPESEKYSWYPINDIKEEGHLVLQDGTDYEKASYKLEKWEPKWGNSEKADCATVDIFGVGSWTRCFHYDFVFLCQRKIINYNIR